MGVAVSVLVNAIALYVVRNLVEWDLLPFVTERFDAVVGIISASIVVSLVVNAISLVGAPRWFRPLGELVSLSVALVATVRILQVFPFDLSSGWERLVRVVLVLIIVGTALAALVELARLLIEVGRPGSSERDDRASD